MGQGANSLCLTDVQMSLCMYSMYPGYLLVCMHAPGSPRENWKKTSYSTRGYFSIVVIR